MTMTEENAETKDGRVLAIAGPVVDVEFPRGSLPEINAFVEMDAELEGSTVTIGGEVAQQIGEGKVRVVCMKATDGLTRGTIVRNTGRGITVPVGDNVLGHIFNVLGEPLDTDEIGEISERWEIHRAARIQKTLIARTVQHSRYNAEHQREIPLRGQDPINEKSH